MLLYKVCCFCRYDYENCDAENCAAMMNKLEKIVTSPVYVGTKIIHRNKSYVVKLADNFRYEDPVDGSITARQVCCIASCYVLQLLEVGITIR
jgi:phosphoglucomutase